MIIIVDAYKKRNNKNIKTLYDIASQFDTNVKVVRCSKDLKYSTKEHVTHIIISGSERFLSDCSTCIYDIHSLLAIVNVFPTAKILGICFGFQFINFIHGGKIEQFGSLVKKYIAVDGEKLYFNFNDVIKTIGHNIVVERCITLNNRKVVVQIKNDRFIGVAFHPEVSKDTHYYITDFLKK